MLAQHNAEAIIHLLAAVQFPRLLHQLDGRLAAHARGFEIEQPLPMSSAEMKRELEPCADNWLYHPVEFVLCRRERRNWRNSATTSAGLSQTRVCFIPSGWKRFASVQARNDCPVTLATVAASRL